MKTPGLEITKVWRTEPTRIHFMLDSPYGQRHLHTDEGTGLYEFLNDEMVTRGGEAE